MTDFQSSIDKIIAKAQADIAQVSAKYASEKLAGRGGKRLAAAKPVRRGAVRSGRGVKRDPALIEKIQKQISDHVQKNPGEGIEAIGAALGYETRDMALPIKKLIAEKSIKTKGEKRATKYFPR